MLKIKEKYIRVGVYSLIGFVIFYILRKRPRLIITPGFVSSATEVIKNFIDKHASDILTPVQILQQSKNHSVKFKSG